MRLSQREESFNLNDLLSHVQKRPDLTYHYSQSSQDVKPHVIIYLEMS